MARGHQSGAISFSIEILPLYLLHNSLLSPDVDRISAVWQREMAFRYI